MYTIDLETLKDLNRSFSPVQCDFFSENCIVCLENHAHMPGCTLLVSGDRQLNCEVKWTKQFSKGGYHAKKKLVEHGAEALSFFLSAELTGYCAIEEADYGTGIDYWLGFDEDHELYDPRNFIQARLEISGIYEENAGNSILTRAMNKTGQTKLSDSSDLPAYISIIEFSTPKAYFVKK